MPFSKSEYTSKRSRAGTEILEPIKYLTNDGDMLIVPVGFVSNLASIPKALRPWFSNDEFAIALCAILHDWLYTQNRRKYADIQLRESLRSEDIGRVKARMMYLGVRVGGRSHME